jgi:hypothetical protein
MNALNCKTVSEKSERVVLGLKTGTQPRKGEVCQKEIEFEKWKS